MHVWTGNYQTPRAGILTGIDMSDDLFIYVVVVLNILVQLMLIRSLRFPPGGRRKYYLLAICIPIAIMLSMRILILTGAITARVASQSVIEQLITSAAGVLLMASPWLVTMFAIVDKQRSAWIKKLRTETEEPV
jgi:hypothetical protein